MRKSRFIKLNKEVAVKRFGLWLGLLLGAVAAIGSEGLNLDNTAPGALPTGWKAYITGSDDARRAASVKVVEVDGRKAVKIDDPSDQGEAGLARLLDCPPGTCLRIRASYRAADPGGELKGLELSAHFVPPAKFRAGTVLPNASGEVLLDTVPAPEGTRQIQITFYSSRPNRTAVLLDDLTIESSDKPFPPAPPRAAKTVAGRTFYLSPDGRDEAAGNRAAPWRNIARVNRMLQPGDTAIFLPGRYEGTIEPARSGAPDAPIVYRAEPAGKAILTGSQSSGYAAKIEKRANIELDGFKFEVIPGTRWLMVADSAYCTFRNLDMENATVDNPIGCRDSSYLRFDRIRALRCTNIGRNGVLSGDMWNNFNVTHSVFENMYIGQVGHRPFGLWFDCSNIVVRDCIFDCRWGRNFEFFSPQKVLMERCVVTNAFEGSGSFDGQAKLFLNESIFRNNLVLRNGYSPLVIGGYQYADMPNFTSMNSRYYANTFYRNEDSAMAANGDTSDQSKTCFRNNIFKNNIFANNNFDRGTAIQTGIAAGADSRFRNNILYGDRPSAPTVRFGDGKTLRQLSAAEAATAAAPYFENNFDADPKFTAPDRDDFTPAAGSPAIDAGEALTVTRAAGKDTVHLPVEDARYFFDGFRIPGEKGDLIMIGPNKVEARIVHIAERQNTLILDRRVSFAKGDAVNLAYAGKAPDLGAYETAMKQPTGPVFDAKAIRPEGDGDGVLMNSDFEPEHRDSWFYLWKFTRQPSSFAFLDDTTAASGKQSWRVEYVPYETLKDITALPASAKDSDSTLSTHLSPAWWEIAKYPFFRFAYRIPKGVPVGITVYCDSRSAVPGPGSVFVAETPDFKVPENYVRHQLLKLVDDDQWHTAEIDFRELQKLMPDQRCIYKLRFWAGGPNGKPGAKYWLDDVSIKAK